MVDEQLDLIRQYCDTSGKRLNYWEKDILCKVLENPDRYDGFTTDIYKEHKSGKDFRGEWDSTTETQYRINFNPEFSIDVRYRHSADGYVNDRQWDWNNASHYTDVREIAKKLQEIESDL